VEALQNCDENVIILIFFIQSQLSSVPAEIAKGAIQLSGAA